MIEIEEMSEELLPEERAAVKIKDHESEGMYLHLLDILMSSAVAMATRARVAGDEAKSSYYQGQADAYKAAYRHYLEMRG